MVNKEIIIKELNKSLARKDLQGFVSYTFPKYEFTPFHENYIRIVNEFAKGNIKKLIISAPPQHGKSQISTRHLIAFLFGLKPHIKVMIGSYSATLARKFNRDIQRLMVDNPYKELFPNTKLNENGVGGFTKTSEEFEIVDNIGGLKAVGRGGGITGFTVDIAVLDDIYKDYSEGNSPIIRDSAWDWYTSVVRTRLHNDSQELIVFTRWNEDDLIGRIEKTEKVINLTDWSQLNDLDKDTWVKINFEAIKTTEKTEVDNRDYNEALYPSKHDFNKLSKAKELDEEVFECLYQGNPLSKKGLLYKQFGTYDELPQDKLIRKNYTDTADKGTDWLCSIVYDVGYDGFIYVVDMVYSDEGMELTEAWVAELLKRNYVNHCDIESNNGGRGFARYLANNTSTYINDFHQSKNKESRIISNSSLVNSKILFPSDWKQRFPKFYNDITKFKKVFRSNSIDDCADTLTGIIEMYGFQEEIETEYN